MSGVRETGPQDWAVRAAVEIMDRCDRLAGISDMESGIERTYLSPRMADAYELAGGWMREAGLDVHVDPAGNLVGRVEGSRPGLPALVLGSHLDTVPDAGRYDGILGVVTSIHVVSHLIDSSITARLPFAIEVVAFGDEEGARFGATLLGSSGFAGCWNPGWMDLRDRDGVSMRQAFHDFGLDPDRVEDAARTRDQVMGYLELHIEQGPILEQRDRALSSVSSIAAAARYMIEVRGESRHIATPYDLREDALTAAAQMIVAVDSISRVAGTRANVGEIAAEPGGVNVIAGKTVFSLDVRAGTNAQRDAVFDRIWEAFDDICTQRSVTVTKRRIHQADAVRCDDFLRGCIDSGIEGAERKPAFGLISFPGHDGMAVAHALPIAMLYVRCANGISHSPLESVRQDDVAYGADAFARAVVAVADRLGAVGDLAHAATGLSADPLGTSA
jgi:allantoate deiminase